MIKTLLNVSIVSLCLLSCIGTDVLDDPKVTPTIRIAQESVVLLVGESTQLTVLYTNEFGLEEMISPMWVSSNPNVAAVNQQGEVLAIGTGQTMVQASFNGVTSESTLINVANTTNDVVNVLIATPEKTEIDIGESIQLSAIAININGDAINDLAVSWQVDDETVASISSRGVLTGLADGEVKVIATIDNIQSVPASFMVGRQVKTATFMGRSGYIAEGMAQFFVNDDGDLILEFSDDFKTSFALGTFIYLSNSTSGSDTRGNGLELGQITTNGAKTFNVSNKKSDANLDSYRYVIVLCKPASITFGVGDFEE